MENWMFGSHFHPAFAWGGSEEPDDFEGREDRPTIDEQIGYHWGHHGHHGHHHHGRWGGWGPRPFRGPFGRPFFGGPFWGGPFHHMMRRGPFGFGGGPRMFGRGDLKYALLGLLVEHPKHGYEMIKDLENRSGGFYSPSAGAIYPTLQLLEDRGWVSVEVVEGKKVYTITDSGRQALEDFNERPGGPGFGPGFGPFGGPGFGPFGDPRGHHRHGERPERPERPGRGRRDWGDWGEQRGPWGPFGGDIGREMRALAHEGRDIARLMREAVMVSARDPERLKELRGLVERVRGDLLTFISEGPSGQPGEGQQRQSSESEEGDETGQQTNGEGPVEHV
jgi:DNA-binding PadR family transcriptional regulator